MSPSFTKAGPGRRTYSATERDKHSKTIKQKQAGQFGKTLTAAFAALRAEKLKQRGGLRNEHGAFTLVGREPFSVVMADGALITADGNKRYGSRNGRMWLAGISAQRGY